MGCCNSTPGEKDGKQTISIPPLHREHEEHYKRSESTTQDNMFVLTDEVAEFFKAITSKKINLSTIPERSFQPQRSFQDVVNLYLCIRLGQYFAQEEKLFSKIQDSCKAELARKMKDGAVLDCLKYVNEFHQAQELFDDIVYKDEKAKLSVVAEDTIDDTDDFIDRRIAAATEDLGRFKNGLINIIEELNLHSTPGVKAFDLEANVKKKQRTKEKCLEMKEQTRKYPEPVENWLYDMIRCRFRISPTCLQGVQQKDTLHYVKEFLQKLGNEYRVIRYKNKMTELGVLSFNVVFETHIAEIQIVFTESFKKLNESHIVYDVSRTKDFKALKRYLETQVAVKHYRGLFESLKTHTITNLHQAQHEEGSVSMIPLFINLLTSPDNNDPLDIPITVKGKYCDKVIEEENYLKLTLSLADCESETNDWPSYLSFRLVLQQTDETRNYLSGKGIRYEAQLFSDRVLHEEEVEVKGVSEGSKTLVLIVYSNTNKSIKHTLRCQLNDTNKSVMIASKECGYYIEDDKDIPIIENPTAKVAPYTSCCLKGHRMYLSKVEEAYECSRCKASVAKQKHPVCAPCKYHVCRNCVAPAGSNQRQQQSLNRKSLLEEQLKVIETKIKKQSQHYDDERNQQLEDQRKKIQDKVKHIEEQSQQHEQSLRNQVSQTCTQSEANLRKCPQGHFMKKLALENRCCDECEDEIDDYRDHLVCLRCNYDLCRDCGEQEAGTRKKVDEEEEEEELKALPTKDKNGKLHCLNDHIMTKAFRDEGYTTCDACGEYVDEDEKHHICYTCNYDLCNNCLEKVEVREESDSDEETFQFKCPKGHTADLMVTRPRECDLCCQDTKAGERHPICEECNYDVCKKCVKIIEDESEPKNGFYTLEFQPKGELVNCKFQCPEGHPTPLRGVRNHHCDICREDIAVSDRHPLCRECDYDVCTDCCIKIVDKTRPKNGYYSLEDPVITSAKFKCPEGHVTPLNAEYGHSCDLCSKNISPSENHPMCEECNYDVCIDCVKEIIEKTETQGGFYSLQDPEITNAKFKCPDGHVMSLDAESGHFCDVCEGKLGATEKRQLCSECNYDICLDCAKEIINNEYPEDGYYQREKTESGPKYKCPDGHPTPVLAIYGHSCDLCKAKIGSSEKHPYCDECDYDVCADCAQEIVEKTEPEDGYYSLEKPHGDNEGQEENEEEEEKYNCPEGHPMTLVTREEDVDCDNCDGNIEAEEHHHDCEECSYKVCTECVKYI